MRSRAMVQTAPMTLEETEIDIPAIGPDQALLRIEAAGVCGSDHDQLSGALARGGWSSYPVIPGHEPIGRLVEIGAEARRGWRVEVDDLVAVESVVPCHTCANCVRGLVKFCQNRFSYGFMPLSVGCGLWGAFSEYMVLRPNTVVHRVPAGVKAQIASLFNPLGAGFDWAVRRAGTAPGDRVLVLGSGQRGIACAIAARAAGAAQVIITGLARDTHKLELARRLGADVAIDVEAEPDLLSRLKELFVDGLVDRVIDTTPHATLPTVQAIEAVRPGGVVVLAGLKGDATLGQLVADRIVLKAIDVRGVVSVGSWGYARAMERIAAGGIEQMHSHDVPLSQLLAGIELLTSAEASHVAIVP